MKHHSKQFNFDSVLDHVSLITFASFKIMQSCTGGSKQAYIPTLCSFALVVLC